MSNPGSWIPRMGIFLLHSCNQLDSTPGTTTGAQFGDTDPCQLTRHNSRASSHTNEYQYGALHFANSFSVYQLIQSSQ